MLQFVLIGAGLGFVAVCVSVCVLIFQARRELDDICTQVHTITGKAALDLDEAHRLELEAGLATMDTRKAEEQEIKALPAITGDVRQSFRSISELANTASTTIAGIGVSQRQIAANAGGVLQSADGTIRDLRPVMNQASKSLEQLQLVETDLDRQVNDPAIASSLHHIDGTTGSLEASAKDVQQGVHAWLHPTWPHKLWHVVLDVAHAANPL